MGYPDLPPAALSAERFHWRAGGAVLQSTETLTGFSDDAMRDVFRVLAPVLPAGMPRFDPAHPEVRYVPEDAGAM
ncbi:hypothetical protein ACFYZ8_18205 [Streptomyces sp. NPDC001668]|uniref:hypothetical protein n=1 Tax=unclassified Streptomyces TaxID=2593676 RepID=UPI0036995A7D